MRVYRQVVSQFQSCRLFSIAKNVKPFDEVPTLKAYPVLGHSYLFFPGGKYSSEKLTEAILDISKTLGPIFKLKLGGSDILFTLEADHAQILYRNESKFPNRPTFPALLHYRQKQFKCIGVVPGNGEEWYRLRGGVTPLLKKDIVKSYENRHLQIADNFVQYVKRNRNQDDVLENIFQHLLLFTIEAISVVSPGEKINCLHENNETHTDIINASIDFMDGLYSTLLGPPIWKIYKNSGYKKIESSHKTIHRLIVTTLDKHRRTFKENPAKLKAEQPFIYGLFENDKYSLDDVTMLAMEVFLGGIDATATTIAFALYYFSRDQNLQDLARKGNDDRFLTACVKETLRLRPTAGANSRFLVHDTIIGDYNIPKGTLVSAFSSITSCEERYFKQPDKFIPHRWLRNASDTFHSFASLPFGHGPRMCPGRRIAEKEIILVLKQLLKSFYIHHTDIEEIGMVFRMNRIPEKPINIKFVNTNC